MKLSIITATYNRGYCLVNIYESILRNSRFNEVEWILVDDGSDDNTEELVDMWIREKKLKINFLKKKNGGKTSAIKMGFDSNPTGEYTFVLDSDDYLSDNALDIILKELNVLSDKYIGILGLKSYTNGKVVGERFSLSESNYIDLYFGKKSIKSDKLFVIKTNLYKDCYELPFENEKFLPDNIPYINANSKGLYKLINEVLYLGDYLEDGMTSNVVKMALNNINGFIYEKKRLQCEKLYIIHRIINTVKYINYSILDKRNLKQIVSLAGDKFLTAILYLPVLLGLYFYRKKFLESI